MIFVSLGTQDKPFTRLLKEVDKLIKDGTIKDKVIVQAGCTKYKSDNMEIFDLCSMDKFAKYVKECDLLITHGGVGSIITGLNKGKKVIAVPRLSKYGEHVNDHQLQIIDNFIENGHIAGVKKISELKETIESIKKFKPKKYVSNTQHMVELIEELIEK